MTDTGSTDSPDGRPDGTGGIVFFRTENREPVVEWYTETVGADVWLEQPGCTILSFQGFRFGFCDGEETEGDGILTFVYDDEAAVDAMHAQVGEAADEEPHLNERYEIYQFFASDPDGRTAEFQTFQLPSSLASVLRSQSASSSASTSSSVLNTWTEARTASG